MKKDLLIYFVIWAAMAGCAKVEDPVEQTSLSIEKDTYSFLSTNEAGEIPVACNVNWFVTSSEEWCKARRNGNRVVLTMEKNETVKSRTAKLMVSTSIGGLKRPVSVVQLGNVPTLIVDKNECTFGESGGEAEVEVTSNFSWTVSSNSPTWCTVEKVDSHIKLTVAPSSQTTDRNAVITIRGEAGGLDKTIAVHQAAAAFGVSKSDIEFTLNGEANELDVKSDIAWTYTNSVPTWLSVVREGNKLKLNTSTNTGPERSGKIVITAGTSSAVVNIVQLGLAGLDLDKQALIALYNSMGGASWTGTRWNINEPLTVGQNTVNWSGVTVANVNGGSRVTVINLQSRGISGVLPPEIGYLSELTSLNLRTGNLSGSIPASIGDLSKLKTLYMSSNKLTGALPSEITKLSLLTGLQIHSNNLSGSLPTGFGNLKDLTSLELRANRFEGEIPADMKANLRWSTWTVATNLCPQQAGYGFTNCP